MPLTVPLANLPGRHFEPFLEDQILKSCSRLWRFNVPYMHHRPARQLVHQFYSCNNGNDPINSKVSKDQPDTPASEQTSNEMDNTPVYSAGMN
jgi:hypothetical protein